MQITGFLILKGFKIDLLRSRSQGQLKIELFEQLKEHMIIFYLCKSV